MKTRLRRCRDCKQAVRIHNTKFYDEFYNLDKTLHICKGKQKANESNSTNHK